MPVKLDFLMSEHPLLVRPYTIEYSVLNAIGELESATPAEIIDYTELSKEQVYRGLHRLGEKELIMKQAGEYRLSGELSQLLLENIVC